ncbi:MAG: hypothetical protein LBB49_05105, partial [Gracilibacteraceae bacterium]|nr:hypothetical protein [Gracilibacteraceae bacterium]
RPLRARGLKFDEVIVEGRGVGSRPLRAHGLKYDSSKYGYQTFCHAPARGRGLKEFDLFYPRTL